MLNRWVAEHTKLLGRILIGYFDCKIIQNTFRKAHQQGESHLIYFILLETCKFRKIYFFYLHFDSFLQLSQLKLYW